ncbi:MAG: Rne/Rng family ribonuclease [Clostridia bacterium]|nr:Rne/Rng family ribonuclease [Clostridia bacterium]
MKELVIDYTPGIVRVALVDNKNLERFSVERSANVGIVGNVYKGKVENVVSGMKAAFVNIGLDRNGFLHVGESLVDAGRLVAGKEPTPVVLSPGDIVMCQVVKDEFGTKGARLTTEISLAGYFLVLMPTTSFVGISRKIKSEERRAYLEALIKSLCPQNMGFILRSASDKASDDEIKAEAKSLIELWDGVHKSYQSAPTPSLIFQEAELLDRAVRDNISVGIDRIVVNDSAVAKHLAGGMADVKVEVFDGKRNIFRHYGIDGQINALKERRVPLKSGGYLIIDKTEALTVIDVNTGKFVGGKDLEDTVFKTNLEATEEIARQLRLRNISGIVVIDFIDMTDTCHEKEVVSALKEELKKDRLRTSSVEMTPLGLVELTRKKTSLPINEFMLDTCRECGDGHVVSSVQALLTLRGDLVDYVLKNKCQNVLVRLNPDVFEAFKDVDVFSGDKRQTLNGKKIFFLQDEKLGRMDYAFEVVGDTTKINKNAVLL